jgi:hypothetical protein
MISLDEVVEFLKSRNLQETLKVLEQEISVASEEGNLTEIHHCILTGDFDSLLIFARQFFSHPQFMEIQKHTLLLEFKEKFEAAVDEADFMSLKKKLARLKNVLETEEFDGLLERTRVGDFGGLGILNRIEMFEKLKSMLMEEDMKKVVKDVVQGSSGKPTPLDTPRLIASEAVTTPVRMSSQPPASPRPSASPLGMDEILRQRAAVIKETELEPENEQSEDISLEMIVEAENKESCPVRVLKFTAENSVFLGNNRGECVWFSAGAFPSHSYRNKLHAGSVFCADFSGQLVATGSNDETIRLFDLSCPEIFAELKTAGTVRSLLFLDRNLLLSGGTSETFIRAWDVETEEVVDWFALPAEQPILGLQKIDEHSFASVSNMIQLWDSRTSQSTGKLDPINGKAFSASISGYCIHVGTEDGFIEGYDLRMLEESFYTEPVHKSCVRAISSRNGKIASASFDKSIALTDGNGVELARTVFKEKMVGCDWTKHKDNKLLACGAEGGCFLFNIN